MNDVVAHIRAALDKDERIARAAEGDSLFDGTGIVDSAYTEGTRRVVLPSQVANHIARHDPVRVLRQVTAMRKVLELHTAVETEIYKADEPNIIERECAACFDLDRFHSWSDDAPRMDWPCPTLLALAEAYGIQLDN